jgi:hypothetical protein
MLLRWWWKNLGQLPLCWWVQASWEIFVDYPYRHWSSGEWWVLNGDWWHWCEVTFMSNKKVRVNRALVIECVRAFICHLMRRFTRKNLKKWPNINIYIYTHDSFEWHNHAVQRIANSSILEWLASSPIAPAPPILIQIIIITDEADLPRHGFPTQDANDSI